MRSFFVILISILFSSLNAQTPDRAPYTATFVALMGIDTVSVETYSVIDNHLYGKAFVRVPEDYIAEFAIHFYPDGSIREFNVTAKDPLNSSLPFKAVSNAFEYRLNMNCASDTCVYYNSERTREKERVVKWYAPHMNFVGGWVPYISLIEWNSMLLKRSGKKMLPLKMINHNIGVYDIAIFKDKRDRVIFGGPFLEYTKIQTDENGRIISSDGTGTPWNYQVTKHAPMDIDVVAKRLSKIKGIGIPSPTETVSKVVHGNAIEINYGRPYKRGRKIFGGIVPYDSVWRTGANTPTTLSLERKIKIGKIVVPKGNYSLYTIPKEKEWILIFNADLKRWPTDPDRTKDLYGVTLPVSKTNGIQEQFLITVEETKSGGKIIFHWDDTIATLSFD